MSKESLKREGGNFREEPIGQSVGSVHLRDFRNYGSIDLNFSAGLNVVYGKNAQGKTNLLEAIYLLSATRLLRGSKDSEAIRTGANQAQVTVTLNPSLTEVSMILEAGKRKIASLNGISLSRASDVLGRVPSVCISAVDMEIVRGSPDARRLFLDLELSQLSPAYLNHLAYYKRALEQRNALLRRSQEEPVESAQFEPWESTLAEHGVEIRLRRRRLIEDLIPDAKRFHAWLAPSESLGLTYEAKDEATVLVEAKELLHATRGRDIARGATTTGPHRDDLLLAIGEMDARTFGSQGQQRTAVLAVKLATFRHQVEARSEKPLLLLDDIFSDLDEGRRAQLVEWVLSEAGQAILTCTEPEAAGKALMNRARLFEVVSGQVTPR